MPINFDPANPDVKLVRRVIHQAFDGGTATGAVDMYREAWCLGEMELADYARLEKYMVAEGLIYEAMPDHFALTDKGRRIFDE